MSEEDICPKCLNTSLIEGCCNICGYDNLEDDEIE